MDDFCRRCGRPYAEHDQHLEIDLDLNGATDYIFDRLVEEGVVVDRLDIVSLLQMWAEYIELRED